MASKSDSAIVNTMFGELWLTIFQFEKQFSRFLPNSELSQFNRSAGIKMPVTLEFKDLLQAAKRLSLSTKGLFNPFILPALQRAGYTKSLVEEYSKDIHDDYSKLAIADPSDLKIGDAWASIPYGSAIDMGGCGKGYLGDRLQEIMADKNVGGYWFSLGGDVVGAGLDEDGEPWKVKVAESDEQMEEGLPVIQARTEPFAVATSGTNVRKGKHKGKAWHHILDPRTQKPTETDIFMASLYGRSAVDMDVLASCAIILGSQGATSFLKQFEEVEAAILQGIDGSGKPTLYEYGKAVHA